MMKKFLFLFFISFFYSNSYSQKVERFQAAYTSQTGGRFEIVQSEINRSNTFKLDKYNGNVYVLVKKKNDWIAWQKIERKIESIDSTAIDKINYQLFMGGTMARDCFLININTGETWVLVSDKEKLLSFELFE